MERRFISNKQSPVTVEDRADGTKRIQGYAAVFYRSDDAGTEFALWSDLVERIAPNAFNRALKESHDVRGLFNHDPNGLLGRTASGTLRLSADARGLKYEIDMPDTQIGRDVAESIKRGDLTGSSFSFSPVKQTWTEDKANKRDIRTIEDVDLFDVGPVTFPAYESTTTGVRSEGADDARAARDEWRQLTVAQAQAVAVRMRLLDLDAAKFA